jgi:hypothetical protein
MAKVKLIISARRPSMAASNVETFASPAIRKPRRWPISLATRNAPMLVTKMMSTAANGSKKSLPRAPLFSEVEDLPHDTLRAFYLDASCSPKGVIDEAEHGCLGVEALACSRLIHSTLVL